MFNWQTSHTGYRYVLKILSPTNTLVSKFNVGLGYLLHQGITEPEFYDYLEFNLKQNMGTTNFLSF